MSARRLPRAITGRAPAAWRGFGLSGPRSRAVNDNGLVRPSATRRRLHPAAEAMLSLICVTLTVGMIVAVLWSATS